MQSLNILKHFPAANEIYDYRMTALGKNSKYHKIYCVRIVKFSVLLCEAFKMPSILCYAHVKRRFGSLKNILDFLNKAESWAAILKPEVSSH